MVLLDRGVAQFGLAYRVHTPGVVGSSPTSATTLETRYDIMYRECSSRIHEGSDREGLEEGESDVVSDETGY